MYLYKFKNLIEWHKTAFIGLLYEQSCRTLGPVINSTMFCFCFQYLEKRFNRGVRIYAAVVYIVQMVSENVRFFLVLIHVLVRTEECFGLSLSVVSDRGALSDCISSLMKAVKTIVKKL